MAHFAKLDDNNVVTEVIVVHNNELLDENGVEQEAKGALFCSDLFGGRWVQTSYNKNFRVNFAGIGCFYDEQLDVFIPPKPEKGEWVLAKSVYQWYEPDPECPRNWYWTMGANEFFDRNMTEFIGKPNLKFLEIGSWVGTSAIEQVKNILTGDNSTITCIDVWDNPKVENYFDSRTELYADKIIKIKSDSKTWLENNQNKQFNFIYIDGDHSPEGIKNDCELSWPLLELNGIMALDDYLLQPECTEAYNNFYNKIKEQATIIEHGYQVWLRKNAT